jgi:hypothetical protein
MLVVELGLSVAGIRAVGNGIWTVEIRDGSRDQVC